MTGFPGIPPEPGHGDPKGVARGAEQNLRNSAGLADDLGHTAQALGRAISWPVRALIRVVRR
ncbi:MAG: hypothetical protein GEU80_00830 [Dehalococcoidia bacterium]|nr:hypothetical protein [Dehalococcoidia bacterium]